MVIQLLECCEEQLWKDLTRNVGGSLTNQSVDEVMTAIKKLAVRGKETMVSHIQLHNMRWDQDEMTCSFSAHLWRQASICKFLIKCPGCNTGVNYNENILHDVVTHRVVDSKIQLDLLGAKNQEMTLEEVFQLIEAKDASKRSSGHLSETQGTDATMANRRISRAAKFTTTMKHALTEGNKAMAKMPPLKQERMTAPHMARFVPNAVVPTTMLQQDQAKCQAPPSPNATTWETWECYVWCPLHCH